LSNTPIVMEAEMVKPVKCLIKGCELEGKVFSTTSLFFAKVAALDGPFICRKCHKPMKVVERYPVNKGKSGRTTPRTTSRPKATKVAKKKMRPGKTVKVAFLGAGGDRQNVILVFFSSDKKVSWRTSRHRVYVCSFKSPSLTCPPFARSSSILEASLVWQIW
jgi:hypothetical protein